MAIIEKINNAKKRCICALIISVAIIVFCFIGIKIFYQNKTVSETIKQDLIGNSYIEKGKYLSVWFEFTNDEEGIYFVRFEDDKKIVKSEFTYEAIYSNLGSPEILVTFSDGDSWSPFSIYSDDLGIVKLVSTDDKEEYLDKSGRVVSGNISRKVGTTEYVFYFICIACLGVVILNAINYSKALSEKKNEDRLKEEATKQEEELKLKQLEEEKNKIINDKISQIKKFFDLFIGDLGFIKDEAIKLDNSLLWVNNEYLHISENDETHLKRYSITGYDTEIEMIPVEHFSVPLDKIQYFTKEGDVQYTTKISGGGGGGSSIAGALVGGLIAGETGAVIASRKNVKDIVSEVERHDNRQTIIRYYENTSIKTLAYKGFKLYDYLLTKIPEKDLLTVQLHTSNEKPEKEHANSNAVEEIRKYKSLLDDGIITQEEFDTKKKQLLGL